MGARCSKISRRRRPGSDGTANSTFFQRVPPELRRRILIDAFGGRTLHVQQPACECRRHEWGPEDTNPATDRCLRARREFASLRKGNQWVIGAMGWLQSCRLA